MKPSQTDTLERVVAVIEEELCPGTSVHADTLVHATLLSDLHVDDYDRVSIAVGVEDEFDISIDTDEMRGWQTVGDICQSVKVRMEA